MRRLASVALAAAACCSLAFPAFSQSRQDLIKGSANTDNVVNYGMNYGQHRYSTLTQINKRNAKNLVPVWSLSLESELGEQAQPITWTKNGKQYVTVLSGIGGVGSGRRGLPDIPLGGSVWTFALFDQ